MTDEDVIFEDIRTLSDDADKLGLIDVALVLEFALDVFLRETGIEKAPKRAQRLSAQEKSLIAMRDRLRDMPPRAGITDTMSPIANIACKVS